MSDSAEKKPLRNPYEPEPELEDEWPGSYLAELGPRRASVAWGVLSFAATVGLGTAAWATKLGPGSEWFAAARLVWCLLPVSALILLVVTAWQLGTAYTEKPPSRVIPCLVLSAVSLALWAWFAFDLGVLPAD